MQPDDPGVEPFRPPERLPWWPVVLCASVGAAGIVGAVLFLGAALGWF